MLTMGPHGPPTRGGVPLSPSASSARVLLIEDNVTLAEGVAHSLRIARHRVDVAHTGLDGLRQAIASRPDLVILDLMLPGLDGYQVLEQLRAYGITEPVLILTARGDESDKVAGFRLGADDYVTKPFGVLELLARVDALLRRAAGAAAGRDYGAEQWEQFGELRIHRASRTLVKRDSPVEVTPREFELLLALVDRRGRVVPRQELLQLVWSYEANVVSRTVDTHVASLRRKLEDDPRFPRYVVTSYKVGYRFVP